MIHPTEAGVDGEEDVDRREGHVQRVHRVGGERDDTSVCLCCLLHTLGADSILVVFNRISPSPISCHSSLMKAKTMEEKEQAYEDYVSGTIALMTDQLLPLKI